MSEKTDVVEVVADAIEDAMASDDNRATDIARAALSSIPVTEEMVEAGARAAFADLGVNPDDWSEEGAVRTYRWQLEASTVRAAIQAALSTLSRANTGG